VLLFAALLVVVFVASSGGFRAKLRVLVSKHFFSYRYDYRKEWLRFTRTLSAETSLQGVQERTIMALADLVESPGGVLWLPEGDIFRPVSRCNSPAIDAIERSDGAFVSFLARTTWIVDLKELAATPSRLSRARGARVAARDAVRLARRTAHVAYGARRLRRIAEPADGFRCQLGGPRCP
jgi:hypothetical protein